MNTKKVLVVGGAGFIGSHLTDALVAEGYETHVLDNLSGGKKENVNSGAIFHLADIRNLEEIKPLFDKVDWVFHLAALPRVQYSIEYPVETNEVNVGGLLNVLFAAKEAGVKRVVYSASSSAYGDQPTMPLVETMSANPKSPYGLQKYIGELYCRVFSTVYNLPTVSLRYFNVYGPRYNAEGAYALVIGKFIEQKRRGEPMTITGDGEQTRDFTNVRDIVRANLLAAKSELVGKGEVMNTGGGNSVSINKIAELIGGETIHVPARLEPRYALADNSLAKKLIGWEPQVKIEDGIAELLWLLTAGKLQEK